MARFSIIDREKVDWVFSQDIQKVLIAKEEYLTSDSETVFHKMRARIDGWVWINLCSVACK